MESFVMIREYITFCDITYCCTACVTFRVVKAGQLETIYFSFLYLDFPFLFFSFLDFI